MCFALFSSGYEFLTFALSVWSNGWNQRPPRVNTSLVCWGFFFFRKLVCTLFYKHNQMHKQFFFLLQMQTLLLQFQNHHIVKALGTCIVPCGVQGTCFSIVPPGCSEFLFFSCHSRKVLPHPSSPDDSPQLNLRFSSPSCGSSAASCWFSQDLPVKRCEGGTKCFLLSGSMSARIYSWPFVSCFLWLSSPSCQSTRGRSWAKDLRKAKMDKKYILG